MSVFRRLFVTGCFLGAIIAPSTSPMSLSKKLAIHVCSGQVDVVKQLLDAGANMHEVRNYTFDGVRTFYGYTFLHIAVELGHVDVAALLLERGMNVNAQDLGGYTPLHIAVINRNVAMVTLLLQQKDIDVFLKNKQENTAYDCAEQLCENEENQLSGLHYAAICHVLSDFALGQSLS